MSMVLEHTRPDPSLRRAAAVEALIASARRIERQQGVTRAALEQIAGRLVELGRQAELFPSAQFPPGPDGAGAIYRLAEDPDGRFALYASVHPPGPVVPPHDHTTWAVIAGVRGQEHNVIYRRVETGDPDRPVLEKQREVTVQPGQAVTLLPEEVHTIQIQGEGPGLNLHFYGLALDRLDRRVRYEGPEGGRSRRFGPPSHLRAPLLSPTEVKAAIRDAAELALLDLREEGAFSDEGHLLFAVPAPLSRLEAVIAALVPRRDTRIVLTDRDGSLVHQGAARLARLGYRHVAVLQGGTAAWAAAGHEVFTGTNVPSKAFGEVVEQEAGTPHLSAKELARLRENGQDLVVLDSRPLPEFQTMSIPGARDCPGVELALRAREAAPDPTTLVVVNCAGRTRSIIGAQLLINVGLPNRVVALENGTMGWELAGLDLAHGETTEVPLPRPEALEWARAAAEDLARRAGVQRISAAKLAEFRAEAATRSLYVFDVRTPQEYRAGHLQDSRSAPGGQLVQATDSYIGTLKSRIVLVDSEGVRALATASWLVQLGWPEVHVLEGGLTGPLETGPEPRQVLLPDDFAAAWIEPAALKPGTAVFDIGSSRAFRAGHLPSAWFTTRTRLAAAVAEHVPEGQPVVVTATEDLLAALAAQELARATSRDVRALLGGTAAWAAAGGRLETGASRQLASDDVWLAPAQHPPERQAAEKRRYIDWELGLPAQIARDGDARFRVLPPALPTVQGIDT